MKNLLTLVHNMRTMQSEETPSREERELTRFRCSVYFDGQKACYGALWLEAGQCFLYFYGLVLEAN